MAHDLKARRSWTTITAFLFGVPLGVTVLAVILGPLEETIAARYLHHPVERVEVLLFCCALSALVLKALGQRAERAACRSALLPAWDGKQIPVAEAGGLRKKLGESGAALASTYLVRRVAAILDFVSSRGSANDLDDQMRTLSDNDALAQEGSYSLIRFIIWAIPILGFLGTVLGITGAIAGVTPEILEKSMSGVTDGLALAFDATALALGLTMILMFVNSLVERIEAGTLEAVDRYVDAQLAHRFERNMAAGGDFAGALHQNNQTLLRTTEQLVERQAQIWAKALEKADAAWSQSAAQQQERLSKALETALERTLTGHAQRVAEVEKQSIDRAKALHLKLAEVTERLTMQAQALAQLQSGEGQLVRLQETLHQNLATLAGTGAFEQAVQSLTAAIHLLTARVGATSASAVPAASRLQRPAA
jgi:biopolymer transport protein ExbB/TolQ